MSSHPSRRRARMGRAGLAFAASAAVIVAGMAGLPGAATAAPAPAPAVDPSVLEPIDPQKWVNMDDMTWDDYTPIPGVDWVSKKEGSKQAFKGAIVLLDFQDQPFLITQENGTHAFGNPTGLDKPVPEEDAAQFYLDLLNTPNKINNGRTINEYWMEQTAGRISVDMEAFGPYTMPGKLHEYGLNDSFNKVPVEPGSRVTTNDDLCPAGDTCNKDLRKDGLPLWSQDIGVADPLAEFDQVFYITAGHDESSTWEEFGPMLFATPEDVPDSFGPPRDAEGNVPLNVKGEPMKNAAKTRYVPWTSWAAAANHWPNANFPVYDKVTGAQIKAGNSTQAESSGMAVFAHEFAHILKIADNYGNPFGTDADDGGSFRDTAGPFDVLGRGAFNGPGGTHKRFGVPSVLGSSQAAGLALRNRLNLDVVDPGVVIQTSTTDVASKGSIATSLLSRSVEQPGRMQGINLALDGGDKSTGSCTRKGQWDCDGGGYDHYTLEVVDRMGTDSFVPDHGVMLAKTKVKDANPFIWTIDANPEDIDMIDYVRADGKVIKVNRGDQRQLNDALFHAGNNSGSKFEHVDETNRLHFYVANMERDDAGLLSYDVAVRSLDGAGPQKRAVSLAAPTITGDDGEEIVEFLVPVTNTGGAVTDTLANADIFRIAPSIAGEGWTVYTPSDIVTVGTGETVNVPVYAVRQATTADAARAAAPAAPAVTLTVTSENDPTATQAVTAEIPAVDEGGSEAEGTSEASAEGTAEGTSEAGAEGTAEAGAEGTSEAGAEGTSEAGAEGTSEASAAGTSEGSAQAGSAGTAEGSASAGSGADTQGSAEGTASGNGTSGSDGTAEGELPSTGAAIAGTATAAAVLLLGVGGLLLLRRRRADAATE